MFIGKDSPVNPLLKLENVTKVYENKSTSVCAVNSVNFMVSQSHIVGIMGSSGSGKTTLLNMIATVDKITSGTITINGQNIANISDQELAKFRRNHLGFIFQEYNLLDTLTIYENIALALTIKEIPKQDFDPIIQKIAENLRITDILNNYLYEVSDGQRQRCACARAISVKPSLILADEPTGALDTHSTRQLLDTLAFLREEYHVTILMVTHDAVSASYCDRVLFLQDGTIQFGLMKKQESRQDFFTQILETLTKIEKEQSHVF